MSGKGAILRLLQFRQAECQPNPCGGQAGNKNEGGKIRQHSMPKFVLIARGSMIGSADGHLGMNVRSPRAALRRRGRKGARGEFDHACTVVGLGWHLNFHPVLVDVGRYRMVARQSSTAAEPRSKARPRDSNTAVPRAVE